jgi:SAM-dependent methyltransferase
MDSGSGLKNKEKYFTLHHYAKTAVAKAREFNHAFPLPAYFGPMIGDKKKVSIADLGAGMFSTTGCLWPTAEITVCPSDRLADEYMAELRRQNYKPFIPIEKQDMEHLTYPDDSFDIVHCVNALDHCHDPAKAIKEMYRVCKPGGWIYLRHYFNTARTQKNRGMHHWNMVITINRDCIVWGDLGCFLMSDLVPGFIHVSKKEVGYEKYDMIVSTLHKL